MTAAVDLWEPAPPRGGERGLRVNLHAGQQRAWDSEARFVLVVAGQQSGKTSFGPLWLRREIERRGEGDYLAASATYDLLRLKMLPELRRLFERRMGWTWQAGDRVLQDPTSETRIILRSADSEAGMESATAKAAWLDEWGMATVPVSAWDALQGRVSLNMGRVLITTLAYTLGWLYQQVYVRAVGGDPDYAVVSFRSLDNPAFPREEWERGRRTLPDWKFKMRYGGEFVRPAGLIYQDYDEAVHLVRPFPIPATWLRYVGVDFGAVNTGIIWLAEEMLEAAGTPYPSGRLFAYREKLGGGLTGPQHARAALEYREPVKLWLGGSRSEDAQRMDWQLAGCPVGEPFIADVEAGIDRVTGLLKQRRLLVFDTLTGLRSDLGTYSREVDPGTGEPTEKIADKEKFHLADALRYVCGAFPLDSPAAPEAVLPPAPGRTARAIRARAEWFGGEAETEEYL